MQYNVSETTGNYSSNIQNLTPSTLDNFNFNLMTLHSLIKKKGISQDQKLKNYDLIKNAMTSMSSMYNNAPDQMKSRIDDVFALLGQAGITINNPLNNPNQISAAMDQLSEIGDSPNTDNIFMLMEVDESTASASTSATAATESSSATGTESTSVPLQSAIYDDFIKYWAEKYQVDLQSLGEALQLTQDTLNNLTTLSDFLTRISFQDPPNSKYPFTSNDDILNMPDPFLDNLVEILNKAGDVTVDKNGKLVTDKQGPSKLEQQMYGYKPMGYGDYFKQQLEKGDPNAYMLVNNVGDKKQGLDSQIQDLWKTTMETKIPIYPSDAELLDMGKQILDINNQFKEFLKVNDPDGSLRNNPGSPEYQLNEVIKSIDATFKPYTDLVDKGVTDQKQLNDALIKCTKDFLMDGQNDPSSANQNKLGKQLQRTESSFGALSDKKSRELQAKNTEYTNFLQQGMQLMRMLNDLMVRNAQNIAKA